MNRIGGGDGLGSLVGGLLSGGRFCRCLSRGFLRRCLLRCCFLRRNLLGGRLLRGEPGALSLGRGPALGVGRGLAGRLLLGHQALCFEPLRLR